MESILSQFRLTSEVILFSRMPIHFEYHSISVKTLANIVPVAGQLTLLPEQGIGITRSLLQSTKFRCLPRDPHWGCFCDPHWLGNRIPFGILPQVRVVDGLSALHRQSARHPLNVGFSLASFAHGLLVSQPLHELPKWTCEFLATTTTPTLMSPNLSISPSRPLSNRCRQHVRHAPWRKRVPSAPPHEAVYRYQDLMRKCDDRVQGSR